MPGKLCLNLPCLCLPPLSLCDPLRRWGGGQSNAGGVEKNEQGPQADPGGSSNKSWGVQKKRWWGQKKIDDGCPESRLKFQPYKIHVLLLLILRLLQHLILFRRLLVHRLCHLLILINRLLGSSSSSSFSSSSSSSSFFFFFFFCFCFFFFSSSSSPLLLPLPLPFPHPRPCSRPPPLPLPLPLLLRTLWTLSTKLRTGAFVLRLYYKRSTFELRSSRRPFAGAEHRAPAPRRSSVTKQNGAETSSFSATTPRQHREGRHLRIEMAPKLIVLVPRHPANTERVVTSELK